MFGTDCMSESNFSTVNFMKPKYKLDISGENLLSELECAVRVKYTLAFKDLICQDNVK